MQKRSHTVDSRIKSYVQYTYKNSQVNDFFLKYGLSNILKKCPFIVFFAGRIETAANKAKQH